MVLKFLIAKFLKSTSEKHTRNTDASIKQKENLNITALRFRDLLFTMAQLFFKEKIIIFGATAGTGLVLDMTIFYFLTYYGLNIIPSNVISSFIGVTFVYLTSVRFVFTNRNYSYKRYLIFVLYYSISILCFSCLIAFIAKNYIVTPLLAKAIIVPVSFLINYLFSSKIV